MRTGGFVRREPVPRDVMDRARQGEVVVLTSETDDRLRAVIKLDRLVDAFLYVGRRVEPNVLEHIEKLQRAAQEYEEIEGQRSTIEITFAMIFILVGLLLQFVAIWIGLVFANRLDTPDFRSPRRRNAFVRATCRRASKKNQIPTNRSFEPGVQPDD